MAKQEASIDRILKLFSILVFMSKGTTSYRIQDENGLYFLTFSTVEWIDVFTSKKYRDIVVASFCVRFQSLNGIMMLTEISYLYEETKTRKTVLIPWTI
jgi:hypothetical protein